MIKVISVSGPDRDKFELLYVGCVVDIVRTVERRNHSCTMDYTDYRQTNITRAVVWNENTDLPPWEQFKEIDCTFIDHDLASIRRVPTVSPYEESNPVMWVNYLTYKAVLAADAEAARLEEEDRANAEAAALQKKADAKALLLAKSQSISDAELELLPPKGTVLPNGLVVFWRGQSNYRGKSVARIGAKAVNGTTPTWLSLKEVTDLNQAYNRA